MAKTKEQLVALMHARRNVSAAYRDTIINKIYEEYINQIERSILEDDVKPVSINRFDVKNLVDQLSDSDRIEILNDIREASLDSINDDSVEAESEVISLLIDDILESENTEYISHSTPIIIYDFDYEKVLDQLTSLFEKNGYEPEVYADYNPKKIVINIA